MTTFLDRILEVKHSEVQQLLPQVTTLEAALANGIEDGSVTSPRGFASAVRAGQALSVVAEIKRASPSKGLIAPDFDPVRTAIAYESAGAAAVSVLTDREFFQGSIDDLKAVRSAINLPVLRKDFIIDESQILEARLAGADAILLIVAALDAERLKELSFYAKSLRLDVLIEVHSVSELEAAVAAEPSVLGVNNRDLHTFHVSLETTTEVLKRAPAGIAAIAESGIHGASDAAEMAASGAMGLLVGESLMRAGIAAIPELLASFRLPRPVDASGGAGRAL